MPGAPRRILEIYPKGDVFPGAAIQLGAPTTLQAMARAGRTP